jgi:hypothetical protein
VGEANAGLVRMLGRTMARNEKAPVSFISIAEGRVRVYRVKYKV